MEIIKQWINGEYAGGNSGEEVEIENPATGEVIRKAQLSSQQDLDHAVEVARKAQKAWGKVSLAKRVDIMFKMRQLLLENQDKMAKLIVEEHGKTYADAIGEIQRGRETIDFACGINANMKGEMSFNVSTKVDIHTLRQPVGVVAGVCPFNFPAMVPMWMHPLALATGNAFILKPATTTPSASLFTAELYKQAGLPDGLFNVVLGDVPVVQGILKHEGINAISFVGSTPVARIVQETGVANGKRVQALGGANNHAIVMPDADLKFAAKHISAAAFGAAGERCMALPAVVAVGGIEHELAKLVAEEAKKIKVGSGFDKDTDMGPVITDAAKKRILGLIDSAERAGAEIVLDGRDLVVEGYENGHFLAPTIVVNVPLNNELYTNEVFGPVLTIIAADTYEDAIEIVNAQPFGNGSAIFTNDGGMARRFTQEVEAGMVGVNVPIPTPVAYYSFGGWKDSLMGDTHIHGPEGVKFYTRGKAITTRWPSESGAYEASMTFRREEE